MIAGSEMVVISYGIFQNIKKSKKKNKKKPMMYKKIKLKLLIQCRTEQQQK